MSATFQTEESTVSPVQERVLAPLSTAERIAEQEYEEVDDERTEFVRFRERIATIEPTATASSATASTLRSRSVAERSRPFERVRSAFRETVMDLDHYEDVYGEPLEKFAAVELSDDVAAGLRPETAISFNEMYRTAFLATVDAAIEKRETLCDHLDDELTAIETSRSEFVELLDSRDESTDPDLSRSAVEDRLDELVQRRQESIQRGGPLSPADGHDLCQYLYEDAPWTYPVLTAATRFHDSLSS